MLVDDDTSHLQLRTHALQMSGFSVVNASTPQQAISIMNANSLRKIDVAVIDYRMPTMNGYILADYLKARHSVLKIVVYSGTLDIPEDEVNYVDIFAPMSEGLAALIAKITEVRRDDAEIAGPRNPGSFPFEKNASVEAVN